MGKVRGFCPKPYFFVASLYRITAVARLIIAVIRLAIVFIRSMILLYHVITWLSIET